MSWWQKKLLRYGLRYALSQTGLLEESALDLENLDITVGKKNVITLTDISLNIRQIYKLARLPSHFKIVSARILLLRLIIPADFYRASIVVHIEGIRITATLEDETTAEISLPLRQSRSESPLTRRGLTSGPTTRASQPSRDVDPFQMYDDDADIHLPTTQEVAKSFLLNEPPQERRELEASMAASGANLEESLMSEESDGDEIGTGVAIGIPSFLANFLQGIIDRFELKVKDVTVEIQTYTRGGGSPRSSLSLKLKVDACELQAAQTASTTPGNSEGLKRQVRLGHLALEMIRPIDKSTGPSDDQTRGVKLEKRTNVKSSLTDKEILAGDGLLGEQLSHASSKISRSSAKPTPAIDVPLDDPALENSLRDPTLDPLIQVVHDVAEEDLQQSMLFSERQAIDDEAEEDMQGSILESSSDIRPGDDNISWGSRRSRSSHDVDLWSSALSEDNLHRSLMLGPDHISTPRAQTPQNENSRRVRRAVSPYDRGLQSPLSWPRLPNNSDKLDIQRSPGSWPCLDIQSHEPEVGIIEAPAELQDASADHKTAARNVLNESVHRSSSLEYSRNAPVEDLTQSRFFTHDEAESMYMSAMADYHDDAETLPRLNDGFEANNEHDQEHADNETWSNALEGLASSVIEDDAERSDHPSGNVTPRPQTPTPPQTNSHSPPLDDVHILLPTFDPATRPQSVEAEVPPNLELPSDRDQPEVDYQPYEVRELVSIDEILLLVPSGTGKSSNQEQTSKVTKAPRASHTSYEVPGTFSAYSQLISNRRGNLSLSEDSFDRNPDPPPSLAQHHEVPQEIFISVRAVRLGLDVLSVKALSRIAFGLSPSIQGVEEPRGSQPRPSENQSQTLRVKFALDDVRLLFCAEMYNIVNSDGVLAYKSADLIEVSLGNLHVKHDDETSIGLGHLRMFLGGSLLISLEEKMKSGMHSQNLASYGTAVSASVRRYRAVASKQNVLECNIETTTARMNLDLVRLDETICNMGGIREILDLGSSIFPDKNSTPSPVTKASKGVRFAGEPAQSVANNELKINARIAAIDVSVKGQTMSLDLRTSALKAVHRTFGTAVSLDYVSLIGKEQDSTDIGPIAISVGSFRLDYLPAPQERDLERMLNLLVPSKDKYDDNDDILIETLLRQRRKGALVKLTIGTAKLQIQDWNCLTKLSAFGDEISKLSAVTEYLPKDDSPGMLTMLRINDVDVQIPINSHFGPLQIIIRAMTMAHVSLPALFAMSLASISARQIDGPEIVHPLVPLSAPENTPVIMARMLGDEAEPAVKVKLFNVCFEYSVPVIMALTDMSDDRSEGVAANHPLSASPTSSGAEDNSQSQPCNYNTSPPSKSIKFDLLIHESAIGLNPVQLTTKALFLLSDAKFTTSLPPSSQIDATFGIAKASVLIIDEVPKQSSDSYNLSQGSILAGVGREGYISIGSIRSAHIGVQVIEHIDPPSKVVLVDVKNELLLLETCADSTQTLFATLGALAPPAPPNEIPQYLTQPMTIEDMMASFTGEPVADPKISAEKMFDIEDEMLDGTFDLDSLSEREEDDLLLDSELTSSLYGPLDAALDDDTTGDDIGLRGPDNVAESLLEDDPFEMTISPEDVGLNDAALLKELRKQVDAQRVAGTLGNKAINLGIYENVDIGLEPDSNAYEEPPNGGKGPITASQPPPLRVRLRDFHVIWNLYDGYDWQHTRDSIANTVNQVEIRAEERRARHRQSHGDREDQESVIEDFLFNSIYIGIPTGVEAQDIRRQINRGIDDQLSETESIPVSGMSRPVTTHSNPIHPHRQHHKRRLKLGRSKNHKIAFELKGVSADFLVHPPGDSEVINTINVRVKDVEVFDQVPSSTWRKFLTHLNNDPRFRELSKPMLHLQLSTVKTLESHSASELLIKVSLLPIRLHVDQDALDFITRFFEFKDPRIPIPSQPSEQPFIQRIEIDTVDMCLDYKPKHVDYAGLRSGHTTEFMNFVTLEGSNIRLKHAIIYGLKGFDKLHATLNGVWMPDIQRNQLPTVLAGLASVRSLVNISSGMRDVVAIPVREYHKDGRIVRSIRKGAYHFGKTTASELARLGAKVALGTHNVLSNAEVLLTSSSASSAPNSGVNRGSSPDPGDLSEDSPAERKVSSAYANQPLGFIAGLKSARRHLEHDLLTARDALIAVQGEVLDSRGAGDAAAALARHAPTVILRPVIGATKAVGTTLLGVGNQIDQTNLRKVEDKYKKY